MNGRAVTELRVVEYGHGISAPFAGKLLADMGADVVKVEPAGTGDVTRTFGPFPGDRPDGEHSGLFHYLNTNKRGITLDVGQPQGRAMLHDIASRADVLIVNGSVRTIDRLRLGYEHLAKTAPGLVVTTITPFGFDSPLSECEGHDITLCALGGVTAAVGAPGRAPLTPPLALSWYQAGLAAASATLLALFARDKTATGQHVDISPLDVWATVHQGSMLTNFVNFGTKPHRAGRRRNEPYPFHLLEAKDGLMCLIARDGSQWKRFVTEIVKNAELLDNPRYRDRRTMGREYPDEVDAILHPWFMQRTRQEIFDACRTHHVPFSPVRRIDEVAECAHLAARNFFVAAPRADGEIGFTVPGAPYRFSATPWKLERPAPALGQHNAEVFKGLGYSDADLVSLRRTGVI